MSLRVNLVCVGKLKEKFFSDAVKEYEKRLTRYCKLTITELPDEKTPDGANEALVLQIKEKEGERILNAIPENAYVIALAINGKALSSEELAHFIEQLEMKNSGSVVLVIGGSLGLSPAVLKRANFLLSFSKMTFPHQLMRVILLEQWYRGYRIIHNEPYHK